MPSAKPITDNARSLLICLDYRGPFSKTVPHFRQVNLVIQVIHSGRDEMAKRSLKASEAGIAKAKLAFQRREWTQEYLAAEVGLQTRQPIWKFFSGRPIERHLFIEICFQLGLDWEEIVERPQFDLPLASPEPPTPEPLPPLPEGVEPDPAAVIAQLRPQVETLIQQQCGWLQTIPDLAQPLSLNQIYTEVYLLPQISSSRWLEPADLQHPQTGSGDRVTLVHPTPGGIPAQEAVAVHSRLLLLGKPGSGKTTFLQYLALQACARQEPTARLPIFIALRNFVATVRPTGDLRLLPYLHAQWQASGVTLAQVERLLQQGQILMLLDGLDEVPLELLLELRQQIQTLADTYPQTQVILSCRLAAQDYQFRGFSVMEMADFGWPQIQDFTRKWFVTLQPESPEAGLAKAAQFIEQLQRRDNQAIRELVATPLLLHLTCLVFDQRLTFPNRRSRLYQNALDVLLVRWDKARGIERPTEQQLSLADRINILSLIAATLFEQGKYFFEKHEILALIVQYLSQLPDHALDPEVLWQQSEALLRAIALEHGLLVERARDVFSFSHLTFQEYLTARRYFIQSLHEPAGLNTLAARITDPRWQEVIALSAELLPDADPLMALIQQHLDQQVADPRLLQVLQWLERKAQEQTDAQHPAAVKAFYLGLLLDQGTDLAVSLDSALAFAWPSGMALDLALQRAVNLGQALLAHPTLQHGFDLCFALDVEHPFGLDIGLSQQLQHLGDQLVNALQNQASLSSWCQTQGRLWIEQLLQALRQYRDLGHDWGLSCQQQQTLERYYQVHEFLVDSWRGGAQVSPGMRSQLEASLFSRSLHSNLSNS